MTAGKPTSTRTRKRLPEPEQLVLFKKRGGKRRGAGRPPKGKRAGSPHKVRPELHARYPVHVVLRAIGAVGNLRRRCVYRAIREATLTTARREDFRIVHLSIQRTHVHLLVEAKDTRALSSGMQGFQISAAKHLNEAISKGAQRSMNSRPADSSSLEFFRQQERAASTVPDELPAVSAQSQALTATRRSPLAKTGSSTQCIAVNEPTGLLQTRA